MSKIELNLSGKDWLTVDEAAHYCGVSSRQFREHALACGLQPKRFMGKQLYEKAALSAERRRPFRPRKKPQP